MSSNSKRLRESDDQVGDVDAAYTVMVATDGSPRSLRILPFAESFAERTGAPLLLVQIVSGANADHASDFERAPLNRPSPPATFARRRGESVAEALVRVASTLGAGLIAMHSERASRSLRHALTGSVMLDVLLLTEVPLLVSGPSIGAPRPASKEFLVTTDGSDASDKAMVDLARWLIEHSFGANLLQVRLPHLGDDDDRLLIKQAEARLAGLKAQLSDAESRHALLDYVSAPHDLESLIIERALEGEAFGIGASTEAHHKARHLLIGSVAMALLRKSPLPLLLTRREAQQT